MFTFGQRLKTLRKEAQLTQSELAEQLGVSIQALSKWECDSTMPDISQIVPLAAILEVTTDCLLGVGGDEQTDKTALLAEADAITGGIGKVYGRFDDAYYACYKLYKEHLKKYPLDHEVKLLCADSLTRVLYYGSNPKEEKDKLYREAVSLLRGVIRYDRDVTRITDAKQTLIVLYLYNREFSPAEELAESLPQRGGIRSAMEIEIASAKGDHQACIRIASRECLEATHQYLRALAVKASRLSIARNTEAVAAWQALLSAVNFNDTLSWDYGIHTKWLYSGYNHLAKEYLACSQPQKALETIRALAENLLSDHRICKEQGNRKQAAELKSNFAFYLKSCLPGEDSPMAQNPSFQECLAMESAME